MTILCGDIITSDNRVESFVRFHANGDDGYDVDGEMCGECLLTWLLNFFRPQISMAFCNLSREID